MAMKAKDLTGKTLAELGEEEARLRKELFDLKFKHGTRQLGDPMSLRRTRRDLARILTVARSKNA
jgi:large subunit ribosomal protein L29